MSFALLALISHALIKQLVNNSAKLSQKVTAPAMSRACDEKLFFQM